MIARQLPRGGELLAECLSSCSKRSLHFPIAINIWFPVSASASLFPGAYPAGQSPWEIRSARELNFLASSFQLMTRRVGRELWSPECPSELTLDHAHLLAAFPSLPSKGASWVHLPNMYLCLNSCLMVNIWENSSSTVGNGPKWPEGCQRQAPYSWDIEILSLGCQLRGFLPSLHLMFLWLPWYDIFMAPSLWCLAG